MNIALYENGTHETGTKLREIIGELSTPDQSEHIQSIDNLTTKLRQPLHGISVIILLATTKKELLELISIQDLLDNIRILLVLSDRNPETVSLGQTLKTSYISDVDSNLADIKSVLRQILKIQKEHPRSLKITHKNETLHNVYI